MGMDMVSMVNMLWGTRDGDDILSTEQKDMDVDFVSQYISMEKLIRSSTAFPFRPTIIRYCTSINFSNARAQPASLSISYSFLLSKRKAVLQVQSGFGIFFRQKPTPV